MNFYIPAIVKPEMLSCKMAPIVSIKKECFERTQGSKSRLTMLVQFPAGQILKKFGHECGVEFLVLSGSFSDSDGEYGAGYYVRNAAGTYRKSYTYTGCTILFKLGQFQPLDRNRVVIDTRSLSVRWQPVGEPGVSCLALHHFSEEDIYLYRIRSECWVTFKHKEHGLELFVCEGSISVKGNRYVTSDWLRYPAGSKVKVSAIGSVCLYVKKNFFPAPQASAVGKRT